MTITSQSSDRNVETIFLKLGGYSYFQWWVSFVLLAPEIPCAMIAMLPVFIGSEHMDEFNVDSIEDGQNNKTVYVTEQKEIGYKTSVVQEWGLVGQLAWVPEMLTSVFMAGMMTGALSGSQMADRFGRKRVQYTLVFIMALFGCGSAIANHPFVYAICRFFAGIGVGGYYCVYNIYLMEFLLPSMRVICGSVSLWFLGEFLLALALYFTHSWRALSFIAAIPALLLLITYPYVPETPRWLLVHGHRKEAHRVFNTIAKWNKKSKLERSEVEEVSKNIEGGATGGALSLGQLWTNVKLRTELAIFTILWFSVAFTYYGISFNAKNLSGSPLWNMIYLALVDMTAFPVGAVFSHLLGRRRACSIFLLFAALFLTSLIIYESVWTPEDWLITLLSLLGRFGVASAWGVITCFTAESFPTVVRSTALGICCLLGNTGGVLAPQIAFIGTLWPVIPHVVFAVLVSLSLGLSWLLKEMTGEPLQDFA